MRQAGPQGKAFGTVTVMPLFQKLCLMISSKISIIHHLLFISHGPDSNLRCSGKGREETKFE